MRVMAEEPKSELRIKEANAKAVAKYKGEKL